ncbi:hypothetical protein [Acinetobacter sp. ANC 5378]|uniref:hypothetical protein n=1 Tax=Acinetobacter sp. ANC 5378 TaxID=2731249 RepID=UPI00148FD3E0|nr:hypothetical protein [Acinetobacter sp. ANC 5378]NNG82929.1 hypothetical protein [Acinetobacter sp. ANC 5378]
MNINLKIALLALPICILSTSSQSRIFDIYPNPHLTDPSLETTFVSKLRNTSIEDMDKLIEGECRQYRDYVYLSIQNWDLAKFKHKSLDEAENYSQRLTVQIPYQQSNQYTFPFGIRTYIESEKILKNSVLNRTEPLKQKELIDDMYYTCIQMNNQKYFILLTSDRYIVNNQKIFLTENELSQKLSSNKSFLELKHTPSEKDKITPSNIGKKINFSEKDLLAATTLINDDIKNHFTLSTTRWIDYKKASIDMQLSFDKFMKEGGRNKNFAVIASSVKYQSLQTENFKNIEVRNVQTLEKLFENTSKDTLEEKFKGILKSFNY